MAKKRPLKEAIRMRAKQLATQADADVRTKSRVRLSKRIRAMTPAGVRQTDSARLIREDRDRR